MSWGLPKSVTFSGKEYPHRSDFREILKLLSLLGDENKPETLRWYAACFYFYQGQLPPAEEAVSYLERFLTAGQKAAPGPRLFDWNHDAQLIAGAVMFVCCGLVFCGLGHTEMVYMIQMLRIIAAMSDLSWVFRGLEAFAKLSRIRIRMRMAALVLTFVLVKPEYHPL